MTRQSHGKAAAFRPVLVAFVRFVGCGGSIGLASSGALLLLDDWIPMAVANAVITVVSTLIATELHGRFSFRSDRGGWRVHLQSALTVAICYAFTTAALLVLHAMQQSPSAVTEQAVYLSASALAGIGRFAMLRVFVFADRAAGEASVPGKAGKAGKRAVALAA